MLEERAGDLGGFLTRNPKGKMIPDYLKELSRRLVREQQDLQAEVESLSKYIEHIKVIVAMQQSHAKVGGVLEALEPKELMEDAIAINSITYERHHIQLDRDYQTVPRILVDRPFGKVAAEISRPACELPPETVVMMNFKRASSGPWPR